MYLDLETEWLEHAVRWPKHAVSGFAIDDGPVQFERDRIRMGYQALRHVNAGGLLVCHRGAFEGGTLNLPMGTPFYDTAMAATIMGAAAGDPDAAGHALKDLAKKAGYQHPGGKGKQGLQASFKQGVEPTAEQLAYLRADVEATRAVHLWQRARWPNIPDLARQTEWSRYVFTMGRRGLHIDHDRLQGLRDIAAVETRRHWHALKDCGIIQPRGGKKNPWSKASVGEDAVQQLLAAAGVTDCTDEGLLVRDRLTLLRTGDPRLAVLAAYYRAQKWESLLKAYAIEGDVVRSRYNSLVATGRMSCSAPNVQQVPKKGGIRECWVPKAGHVFIEADYASLELYTFADTCRRWGIDTRLGDALDRGEDVHTIVARSPEVGTRDLAKVFNYGGLGGMGADTMQENIEKQLGILMPVEDIARGQRAWKDTWPEIERYWKHNTIVAHPAGYQKDKWGRMKMTYKYKVTNPQSGRQRLAFYCAAQNFGFQGPGGDIIKKALELVEGAGLRPVAALHDQLLCEVPAGDAGEATKHLKSLMKQAGQEVCPNVRWPELEAHIFTERWKSKGA